MSPSMGTPQHRLSTAWQDLWPEAETVCLAETASTNDDARALGLRGAAHGSLVIADTQSAGRGRRGASWIAPPVTACSLHFSSARLFHRKHGRA